MQSNRPGKTRHDRGIRTWLVFVGLALALSAIAVVSALGLWQRLPQQQISALPGDDVTRALRAAVQAAPEQARQAWVLNDVGRLFTAALRDEAARQQLSAGVGSYVTGQRDTQLGRLYQAATRMLELERAGTPVGEWWPNLAPYLNGLGRAGFAHFESNLVAAWTEAFRSLGVDGGTAGRNAQLYVGHRHNPFLQYFTARLRRVAEAHALAGDVDCVQACRLIVQRLLRRWVLEPGSPGLRLLAADLLADVLEAAPSVSSQPQASSLARDLRAWRAAYRDSAATRPVDFLGVTSEPSSCPRQHERLFGCLALTTWTCAAAAAVGVLALLTCWTWLFRRAPGGGTWAVLVAALVVAAVVVIAGALWLSLAPDTFRADFRRDWTLADWSEWWRHPLIAAGIAVVTVVLAALLPVRRGKHGLDRLRRLGITASATWLLLATAALLCTITGSVVRGGYERATQAAAADPFAAIAGAEADRLLDGLRAWRPGVE
jgi:hypothetical protein